MALSFPLDRDTFLGALPVSEQVFDLSENLEISGLGDGSILRDEVGPRLWTGTFAIDHMTFAQARQVEALLSLLQGPQRSFLAWRLDCAYPASDPDGSQLSGYSPTISALDANNRELRITGLPVGYTLGRGDMLSFAYGSGPVRYALHRIVSGSAVADGQGLSPWIEVVPHIRPGAAVSAAVTLTRPFCKAIVVPGSVTPGTSRRSKLRRLSFSFMQTLRD